MVYGVSRVHPILLISFVVFDLKMKRKEGLRVKMSAQEGLGTRTESCHLQGPSDGNCTVERRDAGVCVPTLPICTYSRS